MDPLPSTPPPMETCLLARVSPVVFVCAQVYLAVCSSAVWTRVHHHRGTFHPHDLPSALLQPQSPCPQPFGNRPPVFISPDIFFKHILLSLCISLCNNNCKIVCFGQVTGFFLDLINVHF